MGSQRVGHDWATELNWSEWSSVSPYFLQFKSEFGNKEFMIWDRVSSWSCFCYLYRASPFDCKAYNQHDFGVDHLVMSMLTLGLGQFPKLGNPLLHDLDLVASLGAAESTGFMNKSCATISLYSVCSVCVCRGRCLLEKLPGGGAFWVESWRNDGGVEGHALISCENSRFTTCC